MSWLVIWSNECKSNRFQSRVLSIFSYEIGASVGWIDTNKSYSNNKGDIVIAYYNLVGLSSAPSVPSILLTLKTCIRSRQSDRVSLGGFEKIGTAPNLIFLNIVCRLWLFPIGMCAGREVFCAKITDLHSWIDEKMWFYGRGGGRTRCENN